MRVRKLQSTDSNFLLAINLYGMENKIQTKIFSSYIFNMLAENKKNHASKEESFASASL